jgi:hypothetical protein
MGQLYLWFGGRLKSVAGRFTFCPTGADSVWRLALEKLLKHVKLLMLGLHSYVGLTYWQPTSVRRQTSLTIHILPDPTWRNSRLTVGGSIQGSSQGPPIYLRCPQSIQYCPRCPALQCHASGQQGQAGSRTVGTGQGNARCCSTAQPDRCSRLCRQENGEWNLSFCQWLEARKRNGHRHRHRWSSACESPNLASLLHRIAFSRIEQTMST